MKLIDEGVLQYIIMWGRLDATLCDQLRNLPDAPDLAPAIGYSREQVEDALCFGVRYGFKQTNFEPETTDEAWSEFEATLTNAAAAVPTVEEIADHIDAWFRTGEDKPWSFIVEDLAGSIHSMLTKSRGGA